MALSVLLHKEDYNHKLSKFSGVSYFFFSAFVYQLDINYVLFLEVLTELALAEVRVVVD